MATKQRSAAPEPEPTVRVKVRQAFDNLTAGMELETALTPRVQSLIDSGRLERLATIVAPKQQDDLPDAAE